MAEDYKVIKNSKRVVVACDVLSIGILKDVIRKTCDIDGVGGYKTSVALAEKYSLSYLVKTIREYTYKPVIHDPQKACNDIPKTQRDRVEVAKESGVSAIIGFPLAGPATQEAFINACKEFNLTPIMGGEMTHPRFKRSEGGYIADEALLEMYTLSARMGVVNFVGPGNKVDRLAYYYQNLEPIVKEVSGVLPIFYSPGFLTQGGNISDAVKVVGPDWYPIVGSAVLDAGDMTQAAINISKELLIRK